MQGRSLACMCLFRKAAPATSQHAWYTPLHSAGPKECVRATMQRPCDGDARSARESTQRRGAGSHPYGREDLTGLPSVTVLQRHVLLVTDGEKLRAPFPILRMGFPPAGSQDSFEALQQEAREQGITLSLRGYSARGGRRRPHLLVLVGPHGTTRAYLRVLCAAVVRFGLDPRLLPRGQQVLVRDLSTNGLIADVEESGADEAFAWDVDDLPIVGSGSASSGELATRSGVEWSSLLDDAELADVGAGSLVAARARGLSTGPPMRMLGTALGVPCRTLNPSTPLPTEQMPSTAPTAHSPNTSPEQAPIASATDPAHHMPAAEPPQTQLWVPASTREQPLPAGVPYTLDVPDFVPMDLVRIYAEAYVGLQAVFFRKPLQSTTHGGKVNGYR